MPEKIVQLNEVNEEVITGQLRELVRGSVGETLNVAIWVAIAVNEDGYWEALCAAEGMKEDKASWASFFRQLRSHGLDGIKLIAGDKCLRMPEAVGGVFPDAKYQQCIVRYYRNVFALFLAPR